MACCTPTRVAISIALLACGAAASDLNLPSARAAWEQGRTELSRFHSGRARELFAQAYRLNPRDPQIILSFADFCDPQSRATLLRNVIALARHTNLELAEIAAGKLELQKQIGPGDEWRPASSPETYRIPLTPFQPAGPAVSGALVPVSINDSKPLKLLLDSGATGIVISHSKALSLNLKAIMQSHIAAVDQASVNGYIAVARSVRIGSLEFGNAPIDVTPRQLTEGADGVIGMDVFASFEVQLNPRANTLRLSPLPLIPDNTAIEAIHVNHLLFVRTAVNRSHQGWFLLDTGSAFSSIDKQLAMPAPLQSEPISLTGAGGAVHNAYQTSPAELRIGDATLLDRAPIAMDLTALSERNGIEVSGILGFSALSQWTLTVNYRDGIVEIGESSRNRPKRPRQQSARSALR